MENIKNIIKYGYSCLGSRKKDKQNQEENSERIELEEKGIAEEIDFGEELAKEIDIQEWLDNEYPTKKDKEQVKVIYANKGCGGGELDLSEYPNLESLYIRGDNLKSPLTKIELGKKPKITSLSCSKNQLTSLELTNCPNLEEVYC
jgi:Leucine-rich repeat (LRR) protein